MIPKEMTKSYKQIESAYKTLSEALHNYTEAAESALMVFRQNRDQAQDAYTADCKKRNESVLASRAQLNDRLKKAEEELSAASAAVSGAAVSGDPDALTRATDDLIAAQSKVDAIRAAIALAGKNHTVYSDDLYQAIFLTDKKSYDDSREIVENAAEVLQLCKDIEFIVQKAKDFLPRVKYTKIDSLIKSSMDKKHRGE